MTFKHKLSKRLALSRVALITAVTACAGSDIGTPVIAERDAMAINLHPKIAAISPGQTITLTPYAILPAGDSMPIPVEWRASGGTIADNGTYTASSTDGTQFVIATGLARPELADTAIIQVGTVATVLRIYPREATIATGDSIDLVVYEITGTDSALTDVQWSATGGSLVSQGKGKGRFKTTASGQYKVKARTTVAGDSVTVTVTEAPVASVQLTPSAATVAVGQTVQLQATALDSAGTVVSGRTVTWASEADAIATVDASGRASGVSAGTTGVTATVDGVQARASITVSSVPVASVLVSPATANLQVPQTVQLAATPRDSAGNTLSNRAVTWSTSAASVATVSASGLVTAQGAGTVTILATSEGMTGTATVTVAAAAVATVTVSPATMTVAVGQAGQLTATLRDANGNQLTGRSVTWTSSAPGVASVGANGLVTGQSAGTATVTATSEGKTGSAAVTVSTAASGCSNSLSNVSLPLCDGTYSQAITPSTFAANSVIQAQNPGKVRFTGGFEAGDDLTFRGIVIVGAFQKTLGARSLYEDMSFVGGPACGNTVTVAVLSGTTIRRSAFYGRGGRYQLIAYQTNGVTVEDVIFRSDGGWGEGGTNCTEYEPNAVLNSYNSSNFTCVGCILFDGITTTSAELLGGLGVNCHINSSTMLFENTVIVNSQAGFYSEGLGSCDGVTIKNSVAFGNNTPYGLWGYNRNVSGATQLVNFSSDGFCNTFKGSSTLVDSKVAAVNGCGGAANGAGAAITLNATFLNDPRWRQEMCTDAGVTRGWCATTQPLSEYIKSYFK